MVEALEALHELRVAATGVGDGEAEPREGHDAEQERELPARVKRHASTLPRAVRAA